ncbi:MAG: response regulator [Methylophilaceae bacterium]|jgi:two-component system phosphate regulon response regulator OmpR
MATNPASILIVDDDPKIRDLTTQYLIDQGLNVHAANGGAEMDNFIASHPVNLIILDLMMPEESGLAICQRLRGSGNLTPIIILTAKGDEIDRIVGLEMGADDYVSKPFNPRELLARINAVLRRNELKRSQNATPETLSFGSFIFNSDSRSLTKNGALISITSGEFELLKVFIDHPRQPLSRDQIMQLAKGRELDVFDRSIDVQISRLRKILEEDPTSPKFLQTMWGFGYIFVPDGDAAH